MTKFTEEYRKGDNGKTERVAVTPRPLLLSEYVLLQFDREEHAEGVTPETIHRELRNLLLASDPQHVTNSNLNSVYAAMSGTMTGPRLWLEPVTHRRGRNVPYRITEAGRARVRELRLRMDLREIA